MTGSMSAVYFDTGPGALRFLALPVPSEQEAPAPNERRVAPVIQEETMRGFFRLAMSACLLGGLGGVVPGEAASQSCALVDGDSIAEAIGGGCTRIALGAGTYSERLTVDRAVSITGASETANPLAAVITANGGPVITVHSEGDLHLSRVTLRGSGGEIGDTVDEPSGGGEIGDTVDEPSAGGEIGDTVDEPSAGGEIDDTVDEPSAGGEVSETVDEPRAGDEITGAADEPSSNELPEPSEEKIVVPDPNPRGGCIYNSGRTSLDNVLVVDCFAARSGGAVYNAGAARFSAISSIFRSNRAAAGAGGAIVSGNEGSLTLQDTDFTRNVAHGSGGAVSTSGIADGITGGSFVANRAGGHGGAVAFIRGGAPAFVDGATFESNRADDYGGAIACFGRELTINDGEIRTNRAAGGGGIYADRCDLTLAGSSLLGNVAGETTNGNGGALMMQGGSLLATAGWFEGNKAGHSGGALFANVQPASLTLEDSTVKDNHARMAGGGIRIIEAALVQVYRSTVILNTALQGGGAYLSGGSSTIKRSAFSGNYADREGGAMLLSDASVVIENSTFALNGADQIGGGVYMRRSGDASLRNTTLYGNKAGILASGLFVDSGTVVGLSNTIIYDSGTTVGDCEVRGTLTVSGRNLDSDASCSSDFSLDPLLEALGVAEVMDIERPPVDDSIFEEPGSGESAPEEPREATVVPLALQPTAGSPVIDGGDDGVCTDHDQNGTERPRDGDGINGAGCDIGAIEK